MSQLSYPSAKSPTDVLSRLDAAAPVFRGVRRLTPKLVIVTEIIAPYRIPVLNALARRPEIELEVMFLSANDPTLREWKVYKDEIKFRYHVLSSWRRRLGGYNLLLNRGVRSSLSSINPDVVLCGGYNYLASWSAASWARSRRVPLLLWSESTAWDRRREYPFVEFMKARFLKLCTAFVVPGKSSLNYLINLGIAEEQVFIAPNAVDTALFSKLAETARQDESCGRRRLPSRYFLYVGRLVKDKGVFELLEAYAQLEAETRRNIGLVFAGTGPESRKLVERATRISPGTIQFPGFVHREELPEIYALAESLIFPTHSDPWGLVVNEAMACRLPVILTSVAGCALDLVRDGWNGFVIPRRDISQLALAMARVARDSAKRIEMGRRSRECIEAYSPEGWANGILEAVKSVARESYPQG
jgi:glycosyltransferase involved in cell wall biosynthesis